QTPGHLFKERDAGEYGVEGSAVSAVPLHRLEIIVNGEVRTTITPENRKTTSGAFETRIGMRLQFAETSWGGVRCFEDRPDTRVRFAHTGPFHIDIAGKPLRPRKAEVEYLLARVESQIQRSGALLPAAALEEYRQALRYYQDVARTAR